MNNLIQYISNNISLSENELQKLERLFQYEEYKKNDYFLRQNQKVNFIYFLSKGIVKGYEFENGNEVVQHLVEENNFFTDFENFQSKSTTIQTFQAVTDCEVFKISKSDFDYILREFPDFQIFVNSIMQESLACKMERLSDFQTLTATERYLKLMNISPNLIQEVSINDLSSFLGIAPSSLSRIRKQIF
ncbi:putative transcriptional regulator, Crp/Fnr family [Tenacibaculum sp. 190524A05c]|uniref:Crp/Fnr family transcriptional regulator n=1 Tax=Tenacibaculum platacis TaxID=3137852 RepID=UPI0031FA595E